MSVTRMPDDKDELAQRVYSLVRSYVMRRTEVKSRYKWDSFRDRKVRDEQTGRERIDVPPPYREARERVCSDAFLRMRACRSREDFLAYFTGTICSVPQFLPQQDFLDLSSALLDEARWEEVKALSMLALSALSNV